jgi:hypothetical protein
MANYVYGNLISQSTYCMLDENGEEQGKKYTLIPRSAIIYEKKSLLDSSGGGH